MAKVTYYMGAGASAGKRMSNGTFVEGLPCVNEIPKRLESYISNLERATFAENMEWKVPRFDLGSRADWENAKGRLLADLNLLYEASLRNATIDTYAKKLVLQNRKPELEQLERLMTLYFILEQVLLKPDSRYDTFLANILQDRRQFPENIKVLSWNYDSQFEIAYSEYEAKNSLCIGSKMSEEYESFDILKINGSATFHKAETITKYRNNLLSVIKDCNADYNPYKGDKKYDLLLPHIVFLYQLYVGGVNSMRDNNTNLSFAFDFRKPSDILFQRADEIIDDTEVLVIIGYTFPFFNREIDRKILDSLSPDATIYIQDLYPERIRQSFQAVCPYIKDANIHLLNEVDQFFLPPQL